MYEYICAQSRVSRQQTWGGAASLDSWRRKRRVSTAMAATPFSSFIRSWWLVVGQRVFWGVVGETGILSRGLCFEERGFRGLPGAHLDFGPKTIVDSEEGGVRWKKQSSMSCCSSSRNLSFINHPLPPPWFPTPLGLASITSESSITGQKSPAAWKWLKCTHVSMFIRHTHTCMFSSLHIHATLLAFDTNTALPTCSTHTVCVYVIKAVGWKLQTQGLCRGGKELPQRFWYVVATECVWGKWPPCLCSVITDHLLNNGTMHHPQLFTVY